MYRNKSFPSSYEIQERRARRWRPVGHGGVTVGVPVAQNHIVIRKNGRVALLGMLGNIHRKTTSAFEDGLELGRGRFPIVIVLPGENQHAQYWFGGMRRAEANHPKQCHDDLKWD